VTSGTAAAAAFLAFGLLADVGTPLLVGLGSVVFGAFVGVGRSRVRAGKSAYSAAVTAAAGIVLLVAMGIVVYVLGLPSGIDWIPLALILAFIVWVLRDAWRRRGH